ncbi:High-affinity iron transporter (plasmid) [Beijerinckiaceae bacterium RH AL1]|nr:FTR1 family protein [Beijerinckiaceae bacterium]VVB50274.1 High-affinity iron transporter [Beijerinckiaceae bacterium RH CH11]VVB50283.1 High-affinity iron transporter [Beijerinckiaceae bacterium RH AL8]VVC57321.1 High-affinity iron transporter [Beijerinckiaceae bacterium RH AL1]
MLGAMIIVFREVIEAGIIVGIVLAVTKGVPRRGRWIGSGVAAGIVGASLLAVFADGLANALAGIGQEVFNAAVLALAVCMLAWHNIWMARHGRELAAEMRGMGQSVTNGSRSLAAMAVVVGVAVLREGSEVVLFLYGLAVGGGSTMWGLLAGSVIGLALGIAVSALTFLGLVTIPTKYLFRVTTVLITFLAAGLAAQSVLFLQQAGIATILEKTMWDLSPILSDTSLFGRLLHTLLGYNDQPSEMQVLVYATTLSVIFTLTKFFEPPKGSVQSAVVSKGI